MKKYEEIYDFKVISELESGKEVFCHDRGEKRTRNLSSAKVSDIVKLIQLHNAEPTRIIFYKQVEVKE